AGLAALATTKAPEASAAVTDEPIARLGALFASARRPVVFTGAGVSTESGIPDFRSPGGVWDRYDPGALTWQRFIGSAEGRRRYAARGLERSRGEGARGRPFRRRRLLARRLSRGLPAGAREGCGGDARDRQHDVDVVRPHGRRRRPGARGRGASGAARSPHT